jgi:hypothetical protein
MIAIILLAIVIGLIMLATNKTTVAKPSGIDLNSINSTIKDSAATYISASEYFTRFDGRDLSLNYAMQKCDTCYELTYTFNVDTQKTLGSFNGVTAVIDVKNGTIDTARYVRN